MWGHRKVWSGSILLVLVTLLTGPGCNSPARRSLVGSKTASSVEPTLTPEATSPEVAVVEPGVAATAPPSKVVSWVDRHPLLRKPQQYCDNTNSNKVVKTAAAAVVGVPAGIVGELKQIVVGRPATPVATTY